MYNLHCFVKSSVGLADPTHVDAIHGSAVLADIGVVVVHLAAVIAFPHLLTSLIIVGIHISQLFRIVKVKHVIAKIVNLKYVPVRAV